MYVSLLLQICLICFYLLCVMFVICLCVVVLIVSIVCCVLSVCLYERVICYVHSCILCKGHLYIILDIVIHERLSAYTQAVTVLCWVWLCISVITLFMFVMY